MHTCTHTEAKTKNKTKYIYIEGNSYKETVKEPTTYHPRGGSQMDSQSKLRRNWEKVKQTQHWQTQKNSKLYK